MATTCRMSNNTDLSEARVFDVLVPYISCMLSTERNFYTVFISVEVRVHHEDRDFELVAFVNEWQHGAQLEILIDADTASPDSCSNSSTTLYENQGSSLSLVILNVRHPEFL